MEQVLCNVYHRLTHKIQYKHAGMVTIDSGLFEHRSDAETGAEIFHKAINHIRDEVDIEYIYAYNVETIFIPESKIVEHYKSANEFMVTNPYVVYYLEKYDKELLDSTKKLLEELKTEESQEVSHPHDHLTDEEDNFC